MERHPALLPVTHPRLDGHRPRLTCAGHTTWRCRPLRGAHRPAAERLADQGPLNAARLRRPWAAAVASVLRAQGLLAADEAAPRTPADLVRWSRNHDGVVPRCRGIARRDRRWQSGGCGDAVRSFRHKNVPL